MHGALTSFLSRKSLKLRNLSARPWSAIMRDAELLLPASRLATLVANSGDARI
jgi:hypothetical protein